MSSSLWDALVRELGEQGRVEFQVYRQPSGPYVSVRGSGVDAGGYRSVEEAFTNWLAAVEFDRERRRSALRTTLRSRAFADFRGAESATESVS